MTLFHSKSSTSDPKILNKGDTILNLDNVNIIDIANVKTPDDQYYMILIITKDENVKEVHDDEEAARARLKEILIASGMDVSTAEHTAKTYRIQEKIIQSEDKKKKDFLKELLSSISDD